MKSVALSAGTLLTIVNSLESGLIILDHEQRILSWNQWFSTRSFETVEKGHGRKLAEALSGIANKRLEQAVDQAVQHKLPALLSPALHGAILPLYQTEQDRRFERRLQQLIHVIPLGNDSTAACLIQITDVTANLSREQRLRQQSNTLRRTTTHDSLTGLINRKSFDAALDIEFTKAKQSAISLALIICDLDQFKVLNATNQNLGDHYLKKISELIQNIIPPIGGIAARYGGDEFALILPGYDKDFACDFAEKLRQQVNSLEIKGLPSNTNSKPSISLGVSSLIPNAETDTDTLLSLVEVALYQAKSEGQNQAIYFSVEDGSFHPCK